MVFLRLDFPGHKANVEKNPPQLSTLAHITYTNLYGSSSRTDEQIPSYREIKRYNII